MTTPARLVASVRDESTRQMWEELAALPDPVQRRALDRLPEVPHGAPGVGPGAVAPGPGAARQRPVGREVPGPSRRDQRPGLGKLGIEALVPPRRLAELARYGMTASASLIRRHPESRRIATLVATVRYLEAKSVDDALEMLMSAELVGRARTASDKDKARRHSRLARASARLAVAVEALFDSDGWGGEGEEARVSQVWAAIEAVVSRAELCAALAVVTESAPPPDAEDPDWRAALVGRYQAVTPVLKVLPGVITFGASAEGAPVLAAVQALPDVLAYRSRLKAPLVPGKLIDPGVVPGPWRRLVFGHPEHEDGAVSRHAYAFCVLEQFWRHLKRCEIWAAHLPGGAARRPSSWTAGHGPRSAATS